MWNYGEVEKITVDQWREAYASSPGCHHRGPAFPEAEGIRPSDATIVVAAMDGIDDNYEELLK